MKKTLFAMALAALPALAATPMLEEVTLDFPESGMLAHGSMYKGHESMTSVFDKVKSEAVNAAYAGNNGGSGGTWVNTPGTEGYWDGTTGTITLAGRNGTQGESFALVLNNTIEVGQLVTTVTFSGTVDAGADINGRNFAFSLAIYEGSNAVATADTVTVVGSSSEAKNFTVTLADFGGHEWTETSKIIAVLAGPAFTPAGNIYSVSGMSVTASPEPATATLSLLALAGLVARRKRH